MAINSRGWYLTCDHDEDDGGCGEQFDPDGGDEVTDAEDVIAEAELAGWTDTIVTTNSVQERKQFCPEHVPEKE